MSRADWSVAWMEEYRAKLDRLRSSSGLANVEIVSPKVVQLQHKPLDRLPDPFQALCVAEGLPQPVREFLFHPVRKWRFDYSWIVNRVAVEVDGGVWNRGRHNRGSGFIEDQRKMNAALILGWRVLRTTPDRLHEACQDVKMLLVGESA